MRHRKSRYRPSPSIRQPGPHMFVTEAQTLDEALDIIRSKQRKRQTKAPSLKQQLAMSATHTKLRPISLSDRTKPGEKIGRHRNPPRGKDVVWTREQCVRAYATKSFKVNELTKRARVRPLQMWFWLIGPKYRPINWICTVCDYTMVNPALINKLTCRRCGAPWDLNVDRSSKRNAGGFKLKKPWPLWVDDNGNKIPRPENKAETAATKPTPAKHSTPVKRMSYPLNKDGNLFATTKPTPAKIENWQSPPRTEEEMSWPLWGDDKGTTFRGPTPPAGARIVWVKVPPF